MSMEIITVYINIVMVMKINNDDADNYYILPPRNWGEASGVALI